MPNWRLQSDCVTGVSNAMHSCVQVSGGLPLSPSWTRSVRKSTATNVIWETPVPAELRAGFKGLTTLAPHRRVTRVRGLGAVYWLCVCCDCAVTVL